jgi:hypothetical protein
MIAAIEGTSAAGKTTWCRTHAPDLSVPEDPPGPERWLQALEIERVHGLAVCDTDPAKLYYEYALWRTGRLGDDGWLAAAARTRAAFAEGALGLPDLVCFADRDTATLRRNRDADPDRRRHRFRLHLELQPASREWWEAVDAVDPGRVMWRHPAGLDELRAAATRRDRTGAVVLDGVLAALRMRSGAGTGRPVPIPPA